MSFNKGTSDYAPLRPSRTARESGQEEGLASELNGNKVISPDQQLWNSPNRPTNEFTSNEIADVSKTDPAATKRHVRALLLSKSHTISFVGLFLFTFVLYFRPYELAPSLSWLSTSAFWIAVLTLIVFIPTQLGVEGNLTARPKEVKLLFYLTILALLSIPFSVSPGEAWKTFSETFIKAVIIFVVLINVVRTEFRLNALLFLSIAVSIVLSVGALNDYWAGNLTVDGYRVKGVIGGMFGNPNDMAIHLVTMVPLVFAFTVASKKVLLKLGFLGLTILFIAATIVTYSRGAFLALVAAGVLFAIKLGRSNRAITVLGSAIAVVTVLALAPGNYISRILSIFGLAPDPVGSIDARKTLLTHSIKVAIRNPFGVGLGNYHFMAPREAVSHNAYTQVATEMGLLALVLYVMFMIVSFKRLSEIQRGYAKGSRDRCYYVAIALQASLLAYMVSSFFGSVAYQWYVYYLVGYVVCLHTLFLRRTNEGNFSPERRR